MCLNKVRFDRTTAYGFIFGYFVISFVLFFWADTSSISLSSLSSKLIWAIVGLAGAIFIGIFTAYTNGKQRRNRTRKQANR